MTNPLSMASANELFSHNYWARDCDLRVCAVLTEEQFLRSLGSSFESVRDTLVQYDGGGVALAGTLARPIARGHAPGAAISFAGHDHFEVGRGRT